ncbi:sensor histidine kinase [Cryptosporangium sp. NPDC048952]|uniref:sensor histidine kinase n=1 Tax=Cryptosporangium sp. NPDC048952 TaxID=3363961 RepID=UPI003719DE5B
MRRWWRGPVLGLIAGAFAVSGVALRPPYANDDPVVAFVLAVSAGALLGFAVRRPWPVLIAEAVLLVAADGWAPFSTDTAQIALMITLGFLAYRAGWGSVLAGFVITLAATLVNVVDPGNVNILGGSPGVVRLLGLLCIVGAPVVCGRYLRGVRLAAAVAQERAREAEATQEVRTRAARLAERTALARDLHDILAHHVGAMALQSGAALYSVRKNGSTDEALEALDTVRGTSIQVLNELRALLEVLRDPESVGVPATEPEQAMGEAVSRVRAAGLQVGDEIAEDVTAAPLVLRTTAVRLVQEGLTNSLKHAGPGASARVQVLLQSDEIRVTVADDGPPGAPPALPGAGQGLVGLRERVALLGGTFTAGPDGGGWRLDARLPIRQAA